jgi:hypothetical protein
LTDSQNVSRHFLVHDTMLTASINQVTLELIDDPVVVYGDKKLLAQFG